MLASDGGQGRIVVDCRRAVALAFFARSGASSLPMNQPTTSSRNELRSIARRAMTERGLLPYADDELDTLAGHCTEQEDNAAKVERQVRKSAAALLLASRIGERFDAIVTGASEKGTWVRIFQPTVEGKVIRGFRGLDVGDRVRVELVHTDVDRGFIDFVRSRQGAT